MKMLVPTAGPKPAKENADYILDMASKLKAEIAVLHILDVGEFDEGRTALDIFEEASKRFAVKVETYMKEGKIVPTICEFARDIDADLIVMGASKGQIVADWIVRGVLQDAQKPLVIIPWAYV